MATPESLNPNSPVANAKRERRKQTRPGELLDAALALFVEKGFAATRAEEVAARAGVSKGTLFLYFSSKEELFKAVVRENIASHISQCNEALLAFEGSSADMLGYCMNAWWEQVGATKASGIPKLMLSEAGNFPELADFYQREVVEPGQALIYRVLQRGMSRGEFRPMNLDYAVYGVIAPMIFLMLAKHSACVCVQKGASLDPKQYIANQLQTLLSGINTSAASSTAPYAVTA